MSDSIVFRPVGYVFATVALVIILLTFAAMSFKPVQAAHPQIPNTLTVNSTADEPDADPSNGLCSSTPSGKCTLRAAIMLANFAAGSHTIVVPAGLYKLTRAGYDDDGLVGDLDIKHDLTLQGAGSGATIVDGNGSVTKDRVFQILSLASNVNMTGLTIRNGQSLSSTIGVIGGGGLYMEGAGNLQLNSVTFDSNTGQNGGGIYANLSSQGGSITMDFVVVHANSVTAGGVGAGGGVDVHLPSNLSQVVIQDSKVYSNTADGTGGGFFVDGNSSAHWSIQRSEVYSNTAASGGAIGNFVPLALSDSHLHHNHVTVDGGVMEAFAPFAIVRTTLDANSAGRFGGGIFDLQTGGVGKGFARVEESTLSGNFAPYGGGIYHDGYITPGSQLTLMNTTFSGNVVSKNGNGGGIYMYGGQAQLLNTTVAGNRVQLGVTLPRGTGIGAGLYITASATFTAQNSLIANNARGNGIIPDTRDDCFSSGTVGTLAYNLIYDTTNCYVTGPQGGNIVGQDPLLGPLQVNGGATQTLALLSGSPAIDSGAPAGCTNDLNASLTTDQRGWARPSPQGGRCDMGAYEFNAAPPTTTVQDNDSRVQYNGWRGVSDAAASGGTYRESDSKNETVTFKFSGKSVKWISRKGPDQGKAQVTLDGADEGTFDLYSAGAQKQFVKTFKSLTSGKHILKLKVLGVKNANASDTNVVVDGFTVGSLTTQDDSPAVQYDKWSDKTNTNASGGTYHFSNKAGGDAKFTFTGKRIDWITAKGSAFGIAHVLIDGADQGNFDLYDPTQQLPFAISFPNLTDAQHTIEIKPLGTKNGSSSSTTIIIDAFQGPFASIGQ